MTKRKTKNTASPKMAPLIILSNDRNPEKVHLLKTLYQAFQLGKIGLVDGMDPETGTVAPMLAGIEMEDGDITGVYPLAAILQDMKTISSILIPDGNGNYVSNAFEFPEFDDGTSTDEAEEASGTAEQSGTSDDPDGSEPTSGDGGSV